MSARKVSLAHKAKRRIPNVPKMEDRLSSKATARHHVHGRTNPAGSKLARRAANGALTKSGGRR